MLKNRNLNLALIVFAITISSLLVYASYNPIQETSSVEVDNSGSEMDEALITSSK